MAGNGLNEFPSSVLMGKSLSVVRLVGTPWKATLHDGTEVYRSKNDIIEIPFNNESAHRVKVAPYDNHFIYVVPEKFEGWGMLCTCGGPAVLVGANVYKSDASPSSGEGLISGEMVLCFYHAKDGRHADNSS